MTEPDDRPLSGAAEVVLAVAGPLGPTITFFGNLGFAVRTIVPADQPRMVRLEGHGLRLVLDMAAQGGPGEIVVHTDSSPCARLTAPNGTVVRIEPLTPGITVPSVQHDLVISQRHTGTEFGEGRAGMRYRDLIASRLGGAVIASHICIPTGGPVDDYVHFHHVRFQVIFCHRGWVKVLYEDQGEMITMYPGDCILQPPTIRHRVCEASDGMQVLEVGVPAVHETWADPSLTLPTGHRLPERGYGEVGHRFISHVAASAPWRPWSQPGWECQSTGILAATDGLADVRIVRPAAGDAIADMTHRMDLSFLFVHRGALVVREGAGEPVTLASGDSAALPPWRPLTITASSRPLELVQITAPLLQ